MRRRCVRAHRWHAIARLDEEEKEGLISSHIALRRELNEAEQANILEAQEWAHARKRNVLAEKFLRDLHRRMYGRVWRWAGQYRTTGKNIGDIDAYRIPKQTSALGRREPGYEWKDVFRFPGLAIPGF